MIVTDPAIPSADLITQWAAQTLARFDSQAELTIRIVDEAEATMLNQTFRNKQGPTNVLSFPFHENELLDLDLLGDIVICAPVVIRESQEQNKSIHDHFAHMTVHGILHLLGYDHIKDEDAEQMEGLEIEILKEFNISNPYHEARNLHE